MKKYLLMLFMVLGATFSAFAQEEIEITGTVTDAEGEPLIGVNISVKDVAGLGAITNIDGFYKIKVKTYQTLVFTSLGLNKVEILVKGDKTKIDVKMTEENVQAVDEVIVTAMGTQKKLTVTGAVTNVNMGDLKHYTSSNLSNTLAGNVPGVLAFQTSGQPGKNTSEFWIRGISTFGANQSAYILVDGFERNNLDELNIEDIESFTVLKDASATAIYGSKGANGVVIIRTKRGKAGKININGKIEASYNTRTITPEFVDGVTYANYMNEARQTRNMGIAYSPEEIELIRNGLDPDFYPNVDWADLLLKDGAFSYRGNVNLSGGGNTSRYYASIAYVEDQGMYKTDKTLRDKYDTNANYKRWNYRLNVDIDITPTTVLKLGVSGDLNKRNSPGLGDGAVWGQLFGYNAILSPVMYSNGYVPQINIGRDETHVNPWVSATQTGYNEEWTNNLYSNASLEQNLDFITKGLFFTARFGYDTYNWNEITHRKRPDMYHANGRDDNGEIIWDKILNAEDMHQGSSNTGSRREFLELLLNYNRSFAKVHNVGANLRFTQDTNIQTQNLGNDIKNSVSRKNMALAGQLTYNYANRYFIDGNFGYNGTENFADGHRWGFFPAFSTAWNVAEEKFVRDKAPWLNMFKIRYSYGEVGSDAMDTRFPYLYTLDYIDNGYNFGTSSFSNSFTGIHYSQLASPNVTWEVARKSDLGVDLVILNNKFSLTFDYFYEKRTGQFMRRNFIPEMAGFESSPMANVGAVRQRGFDGNFKYEDKFGQVDFTLRGNITYTKNEVLTSDEQFNTYPYQYNRGYRVNQEKGLIALGLFKDYEDIRNSPRQDFGDYQPGDIKYKDVNGDGVINGGDRVAIGATSRPNLIYGLGFTVRWKEFDFNMHFQGAGKSTMQIYGKCVFAFRENQWGNVFKGMLDDRWISHEISGTMATENVNASYPRLTYGVNNNNEQASTFWLRDMRYLRLKNLDFGYQLPKAIVNKLHFNSIRFYITGTNLLTWSKFDTWDPESLQPRGEEYPITKSVTLGVQVNL
ncbi:MAG: SusC/RagA family TonB-linked outer membrane protein [Prevotella sp.]